MKFCQETTLEHGFYYRGQWITTTGSGLYEHYDWRHSQTFQIDLRCLVVACRLLLRQDSAGKCFMTAIFNRLASTSVLEPTCDEDIPSLRSQKLS